MNTIANKRFTAFKLTFLVVSCLFFAISAQAADSPRYLIKSKSQFLRNAFNARHTFDNGFTADLNDWQLRLTKVLGVEIKPVKVFQIMPSEVEKASPTASPETRTEPSEQITWGVKYIYNSNDMTALTGGKEVRVAVLDTGIDTTHPDLQSRIALCRDFSNARFALVESKCDGANGHGTHVAGIIAADGGSDGVGIYGVAPEADLLVLKVCSVSGACLADDVAAGVDSAVEEGANIINLSLGSDRSSDLVKQAVQRAVDSGVLVVGAAGNDGPYSDSIDYPATDKNVISVGAFGLNFEMAEWSSRGLNKKTKPEVREDHDIEFAAPGVNIESTWKGGGYALLSGTSMAAPFISGLAAKEWEKYILLDPNDIAKNLRSDLDKNAFDLMPLGDDDASGSGFPRVK